MRHLPLAIVLAAFVSITCACTTTVHPSALANGHPPVPAGLADELRYSVTKLAGDIGERNAYHPQKLALAADWIEAQFKAMGYATRRVPVEIPDGRPYECGKRTVWNIEADKPGTTLAGEILVIGAHYDSKVATPDWHGHDHPMPCEPGTPGADDNASGVAGVLAVARRLRDVPLARTVKFAAFVNEEPPFFQTETMGSFAYAKALAEECAKVPGRKVIGMISFEMLGTYARGAGKKRPLCVGACGLKDEPDYLAFLGNRTSRPFAETCAKHFAAHSHLTLRETGIPTMLPSIAWSDDWSFWQQGVPAFSATDTAYLRNDHYHDVSDTPDTLDCAKMADAVWGLGFVVEGVGRGE